MGASDLDNYGFDADEARYNRMNRQNPPDFAPGQDASFEADIFNNSSMPPSNDMMGDIFSSGLGDGGGGGGLFGSTPQGSANSFMGGMPNPQGQQEKSVEDRFWDATVKGAKGSANFTKEFINSFKNTTPLFWQKFGYRSLFIGCGALGVGLIGRMFGLQSGFTLAVSGCLTSAVGVGTLLGVTERARTCTSEYQNDNQERVPSTPQPQQAFDEPAFVGGDFDAGGFDSFDNSGGFDDFDDGGFDNGDDDDDDDWGDDGWGEEEEPVIEEAMSTQDALNTLQDVPSGMYTRQYLYDMFTKVLPVMKPDFSEVKDIDEDDDTFYQWENSLRDAAEVSGCKEENLPELERLQENLFTIIVTCDRPVGFKPDLVATELASIYAHQGGTFNPNVYGKAETSGKNCMITIFTGASAMISLKDMMYQVKDYLLDSNNYMPVVFGIDPLGKVISYDLKKLESIIITGMPRSGKSWFVQAILVQMCVYVPPSQLNIYVCDPKDGISDFISFKLPHVKKFVSKDERIVATLRDLVKVEGPRRKKIIGDAGFVNIWDYKERFPDVKLPIIYVLVDEVVTLASRMDKETNSEFRMLLRELISQLPALGIRAFLIPHVLNNDIIEKKTSDLVPCKISVCGDADHIEKATGSKPKDFPYKLVNKGDMAVRMPAVSSDTMFIHGPALTDSNVKNNDLFDYLRRVWTMHEPQEVENSVAKGAEIEAQNREVLNEVAGGSETVELFTNTNDSGLSGLNEEGVLNSTDDSWENFYD